MRWPLNAISVTQEFGSTAVDYSQFGLIGHHGIDLNASVGTPVYAPESGKILQSANGVIDPKSGRPAAGETIVMSGSYEHWLMHLSKRLVSAGDTVKEGQLIGYTGNTGFTTGPHLHWGTRPLNPDMNNGYRGFINPKYVIKETSSMAEKVSLATARILAETILGRDRTATHAGKGDADLNKNHVGQNLTNDYIFKLWNSAEAKAYAAKKAKDAVALTVQTKRADVAEKSLAEANKEIDRQKKEIESLKAQTGDNTKWETLKALVRELVGKV